MRRVVTSFLKPSRTVSSEAYNHDINAMVAGQVPFTQSRRKPFYIDETVLPPSYEEAFNLVRRANDFFMLLPPEVREVFRNDPAVLSEALGDPKRQDELRKLGVLPPLPVTVGSSHKAPVGPRKAAVKPPEGGAGAAKGSGGREPPVARKRDNDDDDD